MNDKKRIFSEEHKENMRGPRPQIRGEKNPFFGKTHTEETKKRIGDKKHWDNERRKKISENHADVSGRKNPNYGNHKPQSIEANGKRSKTLMGRKVSFETRQKQAKAAKGRVVSKYTKNLLRKAGVLRWQNKEFLDKMVKACSIKPNKPELFLMKLLEILYPNEWKYTGDLSFTISGKNPDFTNVNGQKKLIELFGDYWHRNDNPQDRIDIFKMFGWDTLIIWESELKNIRRIEFRIRKFMRKE